MVGPNFSRLHDLAKLRRSAAAQVVATALIAGGLCCDTVWADPLPLIELPRSTVQEYYAKRGDTAEATRVAGFAAAGLNTKVPSSRFVVSGLSSKLPFVCVRIVHASNLYRADFSFRAPPTSPAVRVHFDSKYWKDLDNKLVGALAISAFGSRDARCHEASALLPSTWGDSRAETDGYLLVNGGQADSVVVQVGRSASVECQKLDDALKGLGVSAIAFTHACPLATGKNECRNDINVAVQRSYGPKSAEPDRLLVHLPCASRLKR